MNLSGKSAAAAEQTLNEMLADYVLTINGRDGVSEVISRDDIALEYVLDGFGERLINEQNPFAWPAHLFSKDVIDEKFDVTYDTNMLADRIALMDMTDEKTQVAPVDAYIADYESGVGFELVDEVGK